MKRNSILSSILGLAILAAMGGCTVNDSPDNVVVPDRSPDTVVVPDSKPDVVVTPPSGGGTVTTGGGN